MDFSAGKCRHCEQPTGTYKDRQTGKMKHYVACADCKGKPPPGKLPCTVSFGLDKSCTNFMRVGDKCCFECRNRTTCIKCEKCGTPFWGQAWKSICKKCFQATRKPQVTLADLM